MKIAVFDVAAESGGALAVLHGFFNAVLSTSGHTWIFFVSKPELAPAPSIRIARYPWVKKSWLHRLLFDGLIAPVSIWKNSPDLVVSLQNVMVPFTRSKQVVFVHQSLPFSDIRFKFRSEPILWTYQNVISRMIFRSCVRADGVVVQTDWMRDAILDRLQVDPRRVRVIPPLLAPNHETRPWTDLTANRRRFIYPAHASDYKNHSVIIEACKILNARGVNNLEVILTIDEHDLRSLGEANLPECVRAVGRLKDSEVDQLYSEAVLLFPSKIESLGLPLLEARRAGTIVLASNTPFSRELLSSYMNGHLFDPDDATELARLMLNVSTGEIPYYRDENQFATAVGGWDEFVSYVLES